MIQISLGNAKGSGANTISGPMATHMARLPNELVDTIVTMLDDDALLAVADGSCRQNPWLNAATTTTKARYARGAAPSCVWAHLPVPTQPYAVRSMWPALYAEQCRVRKALGVLVPARDATVLSAEFGQTLLMALPLFNAHQIAGAGAFIGPWLGSIFREGVDDSQRTCRARYALLLLGLLPTQMRDTRLMHMQAGGALMQAGQSLQARAAYARARGSEAGEVVQLGLCQSRAIDTSEVVQHMLTTAVICSDVQAWHTAVMLPEGLFCLDRAGPELTALAQACGYTRMLEAIAEAKLHRSRQRMLAHKASGPAT